MNCNNDQSSWKTEWKSFAKAIAIDYGNGSSDIDLTQRYSRHRVEWSGKVIGIEFDDDEMDYSVQIEMPDVHLELQDGRKTTLNFLNLNIDQCSSEEWRQVQIGDLILFTTVLAFGNEIFPGISWSDLGDSRGVILIATESSKFVRFISQ